MISSNPMNPGLREDKCGMHPLNVLSDWFASVACPDKEHIVRSQKRIWTRYPFSHRQFMSLFSSMETLASVCVFCFRECFCWLQVENCWFDNICCQIPLSKHLSLRLECSSSFHCEKGLWANNRHSHRDTHHRGRFWSRPCCQTNNTLKYKMIGKIWSAGFSPLKGDE